MLVSTWSILQNLTISLSFLSFTLVLVPLPFMLQGWNVGGILYVVWSAILCLNQFINMVVWRNDAINRSPVWCDIFIRLSYIGSLGIISAGMVLARRIYLISSGQSSTQSFNDGAAYKRRMVAIDLALGLFSPLLHLPIFFFVQGHRFDILEGVGCSSAVPNTYLAIFLYTFWHIIIGVISLSYAGRTLRTLIVSRKKIQESVSSIGDLSMSCYIRLMVMTLVEILFTVPLSTWRFVVALQTPIYPWKGLADLHEGFGRVRQFPLELWISDESAVRSIVYLQYATIVIGLIFFFVFGFSKESKDYYFSMGRFIFSRLGSVMKRFTSTEDVDLKTNDCISNARSETTS
ncbi:GPCR fungal pheromone mating factor [Abortiporus biennis]|nr:GPCR fungal pheromone mating factor [Abortiporus biennis]